MLALALLAGCVLPGRVVREIEEGRRAGAHVPGVPSERQATAGSCGANALASLLARWGLPATQRELDATLYLPSIQGALTVDLWREARRRGLSAWETTRLAEADLQWLVCRGIPPLVLTKVRSGRKVLDHFLVLSGYDAEGDRYIAQAGKGSEELIEGPSFARSWEAAGRWALLAAPKGSEEALHAWGTAEPADWRPRNNLADLLVGRGRLEEAEAPLATAFRLANGSAASLPYLLDTRGSLRLARGDREAAAADFREALRETERDQSLGALADGIRRRLEAAERDPGSGGPR